jgi:serine/threonine-protein kinase HipA
MRHLIVYLHGQPVGELEQDDSGIMVFTYARTWLERNDAVAISRSLPLDDTAFRGKQVRPFFAGILPEEEPRRKIAAILGISARNDFAMLERIGGECAGAVSLLPAGVAPPPAGTRRLRRLAEPELQAIVAELPRRPLMAGEDGLRLSLAGAQDKLPVVMDDGRVCLPLDDTPSSHIIKPEPERFPGLVANELLCMRLATAVGLNVASVSARVVGNQPCLITQRYDRFIGEEGDIARLHQEDFCQALGFPPERKYQQEGGPLLRDCFTLLREWSTTPVLDIREFVDGLIFNVLIANADAHGKNYSMLYKGGSRRLAPFYDLVCTLAWPELSTALSMKIGKGASINEIRHDHFRRMAVETNLGWPMVRERIDAMAHKVRAALADPMLCSDTTEAGMTERVVGIVTKRVPRMLS